MELIKIIKGYRNLIILVLSLIIIENIAWIAEPFIFGKVIDAIIDVYIIRNEKKILNDTTKSDEEKARELSEYEEFILNENDTGKDKSVFDSIKIKLYENPEISIFSRYPSGYWHL